MIKNDSIQILIPYYNEYDYFVDALKSVLAQDYDEFSVLVIDDGTQDQELREFIASLNDSRVTLIQNETNIGLPRNFELARTLATGEYVVFLGQDDILESNYISTVLPWIVRQKSVAIVQPRILVINEFGNKAFSLTDIIKFVLLKLVWILGKKIQLNGKSASLIGSKCAAFVLLIGDFLYFPTLTWKSSFMDEFDVSREVTLDYKMIIEVLAKGGELLLVPSRTARYRRHQRSASMRQDNMIERLQEEKSFHLHLRSHEFVKNNLLLRAVNSIRIMHRLHALQIAILLLVQLDWKNSLRALRCVG
jgi:glycosyltransferase involved in cell wall biosynthesis